MAGESRRDRERALIREDILKAAARAFAQHGPKGTTIQEVASEAGYAPAALYTYFKGKDEIFSAIFEGLTQKVLATFDEAMPVGMTFAQRLDLLFHRQCRLAEREKHGFLLFITMRPEPGPSGSGAGESRDQGFALYAARLTRWFEAEADEGDLTMACSVADAACAFIGIGYAFFQRWLHDGGVATELFEQAPVVVRLFLNGVGGPSSALTRSRPK